MTGGVKFRSVDAPVWRGGPSVAPITGRSWLGAFGWRTAQVWAASRHSAGWLVDIAPDYWRWCALVELRPEVLFAQACRDSHHGKFRRAIGESAHNPACLRAVIGEGGWGGYELFGCWEEGLIAHINQMLAAVHGPDAVFMGDPHSGALMVQAAPWAGAIHDVLQLGGRWSPSPIYGSDVVRHFLRPLLCLSRPGAGFASR